MFAQAITAQEPDYRKLLRSSAQEYLADARPLATIRAQREDKSFDRAFFREMAAMGWVGMLFDADAELDCSDLVALHRELGRKVLPEPMIASGVLAAAILAGSSNPAFSDRLASIRSGEIVATLAWQGSSGGLDSSDCGPVATVAGAGRRISGRARFVPWADKADALVVAAKTERGLLLAWIAPDAPGVMLHQGTGIDRSRVCDVALDNVEIDAEAVIVAEIDGAAVLDRALDLGRLAISAELVGAAEAAFAMTLDYLRERRQFGKPIGANQAVQFVATDLFVQIELANSVLANAARHFDDPNVDRRRLMAGCKSRCSDMAFQAAKQAIQLHGAIGYTHECDVSLYVKRVMQWGAWLGNGMNQRRLLQQMTIAEAGRAAA